MDANKIPSKLKKHAPWLKSHKKFTGPVFVISLIYILVYLIIVFSLWENVFKLSSFLQGLYFIGFGVFLIAVYFAVWLVVERRKINKA